MSTLRGNFRWFRKHAGIHRTDGACYQPRIQDLRHTFAVHRLVTWYGEGAEVQRLLPYSSVYLGHAYLAAAAVYLSMTPELLAQASKRFEQHVLRGPAMTDPALLGPWVRRFLLEFLIGVRNLSLNTQRSYRDTLGLIIRAVADEAHKAADQLTVNEIFAPRVRQFLLDPEQGRDCDMRTRNQRLAAIRALAYFIGLYSPEHLEWCGQIRAIPFKRTSCLPVSYLDE